MFLKPTPTLGRYAAISDLGTINIFNVLTGGEVKQHRSGDKSVADILFLENEDRFLTTDLGKQVRLWNGDSSEQVLALQNDLCKSI